MRKFSEIAHPLHALTRKLKNWLWGAAEQQAFNALKNAITSAPTLTFPSRSGLFRLECDASNFATGAVLSQQQEDGLFHPIGFMSKSFSNTEWKYQIHDKEMLAIMHALEEWRHFLCGPLRNRTSSYDLYGSQTSGQTPQRKCLHSSSACIIASISLSWIWYFHSVLEKLFDIKPIRWNNPSSCCCDRMAPMAKLDALHSKWNGLDLDGKVSVGAEVTALFSTSKACCSAAPHDQSFNLQVSTWRGQAISEKLQMNLW